MSVYSDQVTNKQMWDRPKIRPRFRQPLLRCRDDQLMLRVSNRPFKPFWMRASLHGLRLRILNQSLCRVFFPRKSAFRRSCFVYLVVCHPLREALYVCLHGYIPMILSVECCYSTENKHYTARDGVIMFGQYFVTQ